jgi:hypothetical protein
MNGFMKYQTLLITALALFPPLHARADVLELKGSKTLTVTQSKR